MRRTLDLTREICSICGLSIAEHRTETNASLSCSDVAELRAELLALQFAAASCTTAASAMSALAHDPLLPATDTSR
jgi:hypothetical protein